MKSGQNNNTRRKPRGMRGNSEVKMLMYKGPVRSADSSNEVSIFRTRIISSSAATSSGAGVINTTFTTNPNGTNGWSSWVALFDEYRVLALELKYIPLWSVLPTGVNGGTFIMVVDHDSVIALTSFNNACNYESFKIGPIDRGIKKTYRMNGTLESNWINTSSPTGLQGVKTYCNGLSNSTQYGNFIGTFLIEFRGKGV
jgi:hypothetical protein